jgi:type II secretory pathway pseudopilin PulG
MFRFRRLAAAFTLVETTIVLGIFGAILAAAWAAGSMVSSNASARNTANDANLIAANMQSYFTAISPSTGIVANSSTEVTTTYVTANIFPKSMLRNISGVQLPIDTWGGRVRLFGGNTVKFFRITFEGISSRSSCIKLLESLLQTQNVNAIMINGTYYATSPYSKGSYTLPTNYLTPKDITTNLGTAACTTAGAEYPLYVSGTN